MDSTNTGPSITESERYLAQLCRKSFLSLWSYPNLYSDEGRKHSKGDGRELCDLLVHFENDVFLFSDKLVELRADGDVQIRWGRWYRRAVLKSARQLFGAEAWIRRFPDRIYIDPGCQIKKTIPLPAPDHARFHRIAIANGAYEACRLYFGGQSLGSLVVKSHLIADAHFQDPFSIGQVDPKRGFVHVFDELTMNAVLRELDTIADFREYLRKREALLTDPSHYILAAGEEQLLAQYLKSLNSDGEHDFELSNDVDATWLNEGVWEEYVKNPQYIAKKQADQVSYAWDALIEHFTEHGQGRDSDGRQLPNVCELEQALRILAAEPRLRRRQLAHSLLNLLERCSGENRAVRLVVSNSFPDVVYVFLILPRTSERSYAEYRDLRHSMLLAYCKVAKLKAPDAHHVVGIATEPRGSVGSSEDLIALPTEPWTTELRTEAEGIQARLSLFLDDNVSITEFHDLEYPKPDEEGDAPGQRKTEKSRRAGSKRKQIQKKSRRRNRR